jgi:hypothetical protein
LLMFMNFCSFTQSNKSNFDFIKLQKAPDLTYDELINLELIKISQYGDAFVYSNELKDGAFSVENNEKEIIVYFNLYNKSTLGSNKILKENYIAFIKSRFEMNGLYFNALKLKDEQNLIDFEKANTNFKKSNNINDNLSIPTVQYQWVTQMLIDKEICNYGSGYNFGKILNKSLALSRLRTPNNQPSKLFGNETDGAIITFPWGSSVATKVFCIDELWDRVTWFDENLQQQYAYEYGNTGNGYEQFKEPTGLTISGPYEYYDETDHNFDYPIYVADKGNNRIIKFIYNINNPVPNVWGWRIKSGSFLLVKNCIHPFDVEVHKGLNGGSNLNDQNDDVIWYTQDYSPGKDLVCINALSGNILNSVDFFQFQSEIFAINPSRISVYRSPDGVINILAAIDFNLNAVIFFKLNNDGTLPSNTPTATSVWKFYDWDEPTSVKLVASNPAFGLTALVSHIYPDGNNKSHINEFNVHVISGYPIAEYISTHSLFYNSDTELKNIHNLGTQNGFVDVFSMEKWDNNYGIRRFKQGLDIMSEYHTEYCKNGTGVAVTLRLSNPATITVGIPQYSLDGTNWIQTEFSSINGRIFTGGNYFLPSGSSILHFVINIPNLQNPSPVSKVKFYFDLAPQDEIPAYQGTHKLRKNYELFITDCSSIGGCPYVYVDNGNGVIQDNNILHRSEFSDNVNNDILDIYKLSVTPKWYDNQVCSLFLKELNADISYLDKIELKSIDHPAGTEVAVTENNDIILYMPNQIINASSSLINDSDVTCSLQYDSICIPFEGDSSDVLYSLNQLEKFRALKLKILDKIRNVSKEVLKIIDSKINSKETIYSNITDSIAIIFDPRGNIGNIDPAQKDYAGELIAFNNTDLFDSGIKRFA